MNRKIRSNKVKFYQSLVFLSLFVLGLVIILLLGIRGNDLEIYANGLDLDFKAIPKGATEWHALKRNNDTNALKRNNDTNALKRNNELEEKLPPLQVHPLPGSLEKWQDIKNQDNYFNDIEKVPAVDYLIWSKFPIKIYLDRPTIVDNSASYKRFQQWVEAVLQAIGEWNQYLPLIEVKDKEIADIVIERSLPPLGATFNQETGKIEIPRAKAAQTSYQFYLKQETTPILSHKMLIQISPNLSQESILSAIRHELGHGLGIWGHSPVESDIMYFSQVRQVPSISVRDVNTLKKVYEQPTRLGWKMKS